MERQQILKILIPILTVIFWGIITPVVSQKLVEAINKNEVHNQPLITISLIGFFLLGFFAYWILIKLGID
jgi:hypothetical protein